MNYLEAFLANPSAKNTDTYPKVPTEPTKPSSVGSVGSRSQVCPQNEAIQPTPRESADTYPEVPTEPTKPGSLLAQRPRRTAWGTWYYTAIDAEDHEVDIDVFGPPPPLKETD